MTETALRAWMAQAKDGDTMVFTGDLSLSAPIEVPPGVTLVVSPGSVLRAPASAYFANPIGTAA